MAELQGDLSVINPPFLVALGILTVTIFVASWYPARHPWVRRTVRGAGIVLTILATAAAVNARFEYLPTVDTLLGRRATDEVSAARLRGLELEGNGLHADATGLKARDAAVTDRATRSRGVVVSFVIPPMHSQFRARTGQVYLPPSYFETPRPRLPVVELLHGTPGSPPDWTRAGYADVSADRYASRHDGVAPLIVMPDVNGSWRADSECVNGKHGRVQTYLTTDVRDAVIRSFHTRTNASSWAIAGLSEGGYCALQIGLRNPGLFGTIGDFSGEAGPEHTGGLQTLFSGTKASAEAQAARYDPVNLLEGWHGTTRPAIWFEAGSLDPALPEITLLDRLALAHGFSTRFVVRPETSHDFRVWRAAFADSLPWMMMRFQDSSHQPLLGRA